MTLASIMAFLSLHEVALSGIGVLLLQEFIANSKLVSNSIGQLAYNSALGFLKKKADPAVVGK